MVIISQMKSMVRRIVAALAIVLFGAQGAAAADLMQGRQSYNMYCSNCHGNDGRGLVAKAPDFSRGQGLMKSDAAIILALRSGNGGMPSFQGILRHQQLIDVVAYLRSLQR